VWWPKAGTLSRQRGELYWRQSRGAICLNDEDVVLGVAAGVPDMVYTSAVLGETWKRRSLLTAKQT